MVEIMKGLNDLISNARRHSIFALESLETDNPFFDNYVRMLADNHHPNDIQAILNKHKKELDNLLVEIPEVEIEKILVKHSPLAYTFYNQARGEFVKNVMQAIYTAEIFIQDYFPEVNRSSDKLTEGSRLDTWFDLPLVGFRYARPIKNDYKDPDAIEDNDTSEVRWRKYRDLINKMMTRMTYEERQDWVNATDEYFGGED